MSKIGWGKYNEYEGPFYFGKFKFQLPEKNTLDDKLLAIISATEGNFDSINMYDKCIISVGIIQWCEANYFGVSQMLSEFCKKHGRNELDLAFVKIYEHLGYNCWAADKIGDFNFIDKSGNKINTIEKQQQFFLGCDGKIGSWNENAKKLASIWIESFIILLSNQKMVDFQKGYTTRRAKTLFLNKDVAKVLFPNDLKPIETSNEYINAAYLAYMSYSANNPKKARNNFLEAHKKHLESFGTKIWLLEILKSMTFTDKIKIYRDRYDKIVDILNRIYKVDLPKSHTNLLKV
jgi:hypothetical protein